MTAYGELLTPSATKVPVGVTERECTTGRNPDPFLQEPSVVETERAATVYRTTTGPDGDQSCPGNPPVKRLLELREPLADRALLDGSTWPPSPATRARP
ncbi:MAG: hypothetical protein H0T14_06840 [Nocardioidaceae bacterium]|nr:hypothetical protein [Nocardioidaceae bacterium]